MKKHLLLTIIVVLNSQLINAQTVAQDWTKTDCISNSHSLFADYLDNYKVVLMEFGMGCSTCGIAGQYFQQLKDKYDISHPGEFKFFYMDYWASNDCITDVNPFIASYGLNPDGVFSNCASELAYYMTGAPMPAYVIAAGPYHAIYLEKNYYNNSDTALVRITIDSALAHMANVGVNEIKNNFKIASFPNPANNELQVLLPGQVGKIKVEVIDVSGRLISTQTFIGNGSISMNQKIDVTSMSNGLYNLRISHNNVIENIHIIISH